MTPLRMVFNSIYPAWFSALFLSLFATNVMAQVDIKQWQTQQGAQVLFVQNDQLPMVDIEVSFAAGSARDGDSKGLANMTSIMLGSGTLKHNEQHISDTFNSLGAQFSTQAGRDKASLSLRALSRKDILQPALQQFVEVVTQARFSPELLARDLKRVQQGIQQKSVQPQAIANDALWETLYQDHPYASPVEGDIETLASINVEDLKAFYERYYVAKNAVIAIVGDIAKVQAKVLAKKISSQLPKGQKASNLPKPTAVTQAKTVMIDFDSTQTYYSLSQLGMQRGHPDYVSLFVGNHLLGGSGFGSFLMEEVREKRGLVYSVYSYFAPYQTTGPFVMGLSTKNASAYEADQVMQQTLKDFLTGFSDDKFASIKENLIGGFALRTDSNAKILGYLSVIGFYDLPLDYLQWFPKQVEKVSKQDVLTAWNKLIDPNKMVKIMVGRPVKPE